jgi:hydroxymethylbilane synthase
MTLQPATAIQHPQFKPREIPRIMTHTFRIGTRKTALALLQTQIVAEALTSIFPGGRVEVVTMDTLGDQIMDKPLPDIGGKGIFTDTLETALRAKQIDFAVHSLKDLPVTAPDGLMLGAILRRASAADVLISRQYDSLAALPTGARVGTSSRRRAAQLKHLRPDLQMLDVRGSVLTRLSKALDGDEYDAIVLAQAGIERLNRPEVIREVLPLDVMLPAPGQGALAVQCRADSYWHMMLAPLNDADTAAAVTAERAFLAALGGGCSQPIAAYATVEAGKLHLRGRIITVDGAQQWDAADSFDIGQPQQAGQFIADNLRAQGAILT